MTTFNRVVATLLWVVLMAILAVCAAAPFRVLEQVQIWLNGLNATATQMRAVDPTNFLLGQATVGIAAILIFGLLIALEIWTGQRHGVRIQTAEGGRAEMDIKSIHRRLIWHLDQLAEIVTVVPLVKSKRGAVDIKLEIEAAPDTDVPMKTDEVVDVTRSIIEEDLGLRLGKLDVHMRYAPFEPDWVG